MANILAEVPDGAMYIRFEISAELSPTASEVKLVAAVKRLASRVASSFTEEPRRVKVFTSVVRIINDSILSARTDDDYVQIMRSAEILILLEARKIREEYIAQFLSYARWPLVGGLALILLWLFAILQLQNIYVFLKPLGDSIVGVSVNMVGAVGFTLIGLVIG